MNDNYKRRLNLRPTFMVFLGLMMALIMLSIFFVYQFSFATIFLFVLILTFVLFSIGICIFRIFLKHPFLITYAKHLLFFLIAFFVMVGYGYAVFHQIEKSPEFNEKVIVVGEINQVVSGETYQVIYLDHAKVIDRKGKVHELSYDITLMHYGIQPQFQVGMVGAYSGYLNKLSLQQDFSSWIKGIGYQLDGALDSEYRVEHHWSQTLKEHVKGLLDENMTPDLAGLSYGSLFGDKNFVETETKSAFTGSGLGHMLAVSGLHITLFVAILTFLLKKTKIPRYIRFGIVLIFLLLYCHICGYSASCVRASIMSLVVLLGYILGLPYDSLSSLGLAGTIILLIQPLQLFTVGFQLSFIAIISIITIAPTLEKLLRKIKFPKALASALAVTLAVNIGMIAVMIAHFKQVYLLSLFSNLIAIPLFQVGYTLLVFCVIASLLCPFLQGLLILPAVLFHVVKYIALLFSSLPFARITIFHVGVMTTLLLISAAFILKYYMCKISIKYTLSLTLFALMLVSLIVENIPANISRDAITVIGQSGSVVIENAKEKKRIVIGQGNFTQNTKLWDYVHEQKLYKIDALIYYELNYKDVSYINTYEEKYKISEFYVSVENEQVLSDKVDVLSELVIDHWRIKPLLIGEKYAGYSLTTASYKIAILDTPLKSQWKEIENQAFDIMVIEKLNFDITPQTGVQYYVKGGRADRVEGIHYIGTDIIKVGV